MNDKTLRAVMMGVFIPLLIICAFIVGVFILRRHQNQRNHSYRYDELNNDNMDEDEIEFKRMIESTHGSSEFEEEDIESMFGEDSGHDDLSFSTKDKDRLHMLEKLRSNLVADGADITKEEVKSEALETANISHDSDEEENMRL